MEAPVVKVGDWIEVGRIDGVVLSVMGAGRLEVGYYQNQSKAIGESVVWRDGAWDFEHSGPAGTYLRGADEALVKRGPRG